MDDQLLIRAYNVGVGDCIYVRIPKARKKGGRTDDFHILIDCGKKGSDELLEQAILQLKEELPDEDGKKRLDLLIVSHEHEDHIKGIDPAWFEDIKIENLWMSVAMDRDHPQSKFAHQIHGMAETAMRNIAMRGLALSPALADIVNRYGVTNTKAVDALRNGLPTQNGIKPLYVHAGMKPADLRPETLAGREEAHAGVSLRVPEFGHGLEEDFHVVISWHEAGRTRCAPHLVLGEGRAL